MARPGVAPGRAFFSLINRINSGTITKGSPAMRTAARRAMAMCALLTLAMAPVACRPQDGKGQSAVPERDIKTVMEAHADELMAVPGVTAVAIGALQDGTPCIKVYVLKSTDEIKRRIPKRLEGHPVVVEVSGEIKPMRGE
jgi:hypothetical protein